jgi:hypothetical protein
MNRIIEQLKEQRAKTKEDFIKMSFVARNCKDNSPCPDTDAILDIIGELNDAISVLENADAEKTPVTGEVSFSGNFVQRENKTEFL